MDFGYDASGSNVIMNLSVDQSYNGLSCNWLKKNKRVEIAF